MLPMPLTDSTRVMKAPSDWNAEEKGECLDLHILDTTDDQGAPVMISAWRLEEGELEKLAAGAPLFLRIYGRGHPVVSLWTGDPQDTRQ